MSRYCFITGFLRSGTTLVEKLVHALPGACIGPQPFPFLYYDAKRAFLRTRGVEDERYPLGHLFGEDRYRLVDFEAYLAHHRVAREALAESFAGMQHYSGWKLPAMATHAANVGEGSFAEVYRALCDGLPRILGREGSNLLGAKEVFCEEFIPYFLGQGVSVILVLRDIRDLLASLKFGGGATYGDRGLPLLHVVRQWRKSVAFALEFSGTRDFHLVRFESLVASARTELDQLALHLGSPPAAAGAIDDLRDQDGRSWEGNSSFAPVRGVSRDPVGRFADKLPASWVAAVESLCGPEMAAMGLVPSGGTGYREGEVAETMARTAQEIDLVAPGATLTAEINAERKRAMMLERADADEAEQRRWFIFPRAYRRLARSGSVSL
ncbi:MAG: hypothetical protein ACREUK_03955 [Burkholderiales bacterium]